MAISSRDLQLGDVLITLSNKLVSHAGVVGDSIESGPFNQRVKKPGMIYHATMGGILEDPVGQWISGRGASDVFRLTSMPAGGGEKIGAIAKELRKRCEYGKFRAWFESWTGTSAFGPAAKGRLYEYQAKLKMGNGPFITDVYCSEYVILCYQLAADGNSGSPLFIALDGKHSLPKDLRSWFLQHTSTWTALGELTG
jgi:hypothetical protein